MLIVEQRQNKRDDYLVALYELSGGSTTQWATHRQIAEESGIPEAEVMDVGQAVSDQRHAEFMTSGGIAGGHVAITAVGTRRAEQIITERQRSGAPRYTTVVLLTDPELVRSLEPLVAMIRNDLETKEVASEVRPDLQADLESAEHQLRANNPNRGVIRESLIRIRDNWPAVVAGSIGVVANIIGILHGL